MKEFDALNSPLQHIDTIHNVELWMKRDDRIHPEVSGNKWRKLKYYLEDFRRSDKEVILTFGGAFSNHLAATAALGKMAGIPTKALVRGEEVQSNPTLDFCRACGMEIEAISRKRYDTKDDPEFVAMMAEALPEVYMIPEGGKGVLGMQGCAEVVNELPEGFDVICVAGGTGTTMAGMLTADYPAQYVLYPALKGGVFLKRAIDGYLTDFQRAFSTKGHGKKMGMERLLVEEDYHFGGYGKTRPELIHFMNGFYDRYCIPLDPVYTGKMLFGIMEGLEKKKWEAGTKIVAIHTGGLQGIKGMNQRLQKSGNTLRYEG
ncbi:MAG TPA: 1-aminocyclopropane-1-carboxylate deaminase [Cryomorphaceae bacterium]|nr:1-aminocyclopropane-1-carboxylate deaminase [Owenweeksia sp.]HAD98077.1 1-aminocyclopropane-1-carboxylate deaminase [Cryomorphaceae bacterium]HBF21947.1 1-aminocyclopropane-1-carboxylate deaminase [Cryomorphaceae bacterium]HCQ15343.1 1-aminocyclopropane-1-carboxylate deaminase [Cryomorphaceae bacterium]